MTPFKLLSLLLSYPDAELLDLRPEIEAEALALPSGAREAILGFLAGERSLGALQLQAEYVATFDFDRRVTLDLTYFLEGDRRQRGVALLRLRRLLRALGLEQTGDELPDHLPLLLELADVVGPEAGAEILAEFRAPLELIGAALRERGSRYAALIEAVSALLGPLDADQADLAAAIARIGPPSETVGLEPFAPPELMPAPACGGVA